MTIARSKDVPPNTELIQGPKGGVYYLRNGRKVYIYQEKRPARKNSFTLRKGAFARYVKYTTPS